jgi:hypothetical protein
MMTDNDLQYHLNFRQKDLLDAAKEYRLARLAQEACDKSKDILAFLTPLVKLSLLAFLVYELSLMILG